MPVLDIQSRFDELLNLVKAHLAWIMVTTTKYIPVGVRADQDVVALPS